MTERGEGSGAVEGPEAAGALDARIARWRAELHRRRGVEAGEVERREKRLRRHLVAIEEAGLTEEEAFGVASRRVEREAAGEEGDAASAMDGPGDRPGNRPARTELFVVLGLALLAAAAIKLPDAFGLRLGESTFHPRNAALFVFPLLTGYFAWKRGLDRAQCLWLAGAFAAAAIAVNAYPFAPGGHTEVLAALHLPIALWLVVGIAHAGGVWRGNSAGRMDFVRFSGELFIHYVLMALGGGVLTAFTILTFAAIGLDVEGTAQLWILPTGAMGAVLVGAWLVESRSGVAGNMAPVLTRIFTPLFAALLLAVLGAMAWTGGGVGVEREVLIAFDLLLAVVLGLLLYAVSARDPEAPPGLFDRMLLVLVVSALVADGVALAAIAGRISEFGFSPNRVAVLGENLVLLGNLGWSAWLYGRFVAGRGPFRALERWQTAYLPVYAGWAALVVFVFPPLFGFI